VLPLAPLASLATLRLAANKAPEQEMGQLKAVADGNRGCFIISG